MKAAGADLRGKILLDTGMPSTYTLSRFNRILAGTLSGF